jgi:hypothetical protein
VDPYPHLPTHTYLDLKPLVLMFRQLAKNEEEDNSAVEVYFQCGPDNLALRAALDLLEQASSEPCFNTLRTQQQLGYSVGCGVRLTHNILGFAFIILSGGFFDCLQSLSRGFAFVILSGGSLIACNRLAGALPSSSSLVGSLIACNRMAGALPSSPSLGVLSLLPIT